MAGDMGSTVWRRETQAVMAAGWAGNGVPGWAAQCSTASDKRVHAWLLRGSDCQRMINGRESHGDLGEKMSKTLGLTEAVQLQRLWPKWVRSEE